MTARGEAAGARRLVAYVVFRQPAAVVPSTGELREFLAATLPDPMVPTAWARLDSLPVTSTGKLDRRELARLAPDEIWSGGEGFVPPRNPVEELLAGIWSEVLGVERVGAFDEFFQLGGHSLLATQVASRVREAFGIDLPLRRIFEAPTLAALAEAVAAAQADGSAAGPPPIRREPREGDLPLSFAQERLWFLHRLQPESAAYNIPLALRAEGPLDPARLAAALSEVVRRHEVLRTVFAERDGEPAQVVLPAAGVPLPRADLRALPADRREPEARRIAAEEAGRPFDLARGPLLRSLLVELAAERRVLLLDLHHIVTDGWSMGVLLREVKALYAGSPPPEPPVQYADFAIWQRRWLAGATLEYQLAWWRRRLQGAPAALELPADHPRPPVQTMRGAEHRFALDAGLSRGIAGLARREEVTPFMVLAAGLLTLLSRLTGQRDLTIGSPIANRNHREIEGSIGFFVNTLVLRADLSRAGSFRELLRQVRELSLGAYAHQDLPFEKLVEALQPDRDLSRSPLFQVALALQNAPLPEADLGEARLFPDETPGGVAKFDLSFGFLELSDGRLAGALQYAADLFEAPTAARLARQLALLLAGLIERPEAPLAAPPLLPPGERHQILYEWNDTRREWPDDPALHQLFERRADLQPAAIALLGGGEILTYGELEARANRLAHHLGGLGISRSQPVGLWMHRSPALPVAMLGILKAGAVYVPLDAAWPADRVETILAGTQARALIAGSALLRSVWEIERRLPALRHVVCPEEPAPRPAPEPLDPGAVTSLWDWVAERAVDRVSAGGFFSSSTGEPFSEAEVDEYRDRVLELARPWLGPDQRVLEIGCGAGLILWELARRAGHAVGLDPSALTQEKNRETARREGYGNVELATGFAHEIEAWPEGSFDLIVLASTVQFFPGPFYLERVLGLCLRLLAPGGAVVVADVHDGGRQEELRRSIAGAAAGSPPRPDVGVGTLALDERMFQELRKVLPELAGVEVHHRRQGFANELRFRYDVVLTRGGPPLPAAAPGGWTTGWHVAASPATRPAPACGPEDFAYLIHTSGSTGLPKGIVIRHRAAVNTLRWNNETLGIGPGDRHLFVNSIGFDLSIYDVLGMLGAGAAVRVAGEEELQDPGRLAAVLRDGEITTWSSAPAALQRLTPFFPAPGEGRTLRRVLLAGDWIPLSLPNLVQTAFPGALVGNFGGATENRHLVELAPDWRGPSVLGEHPLRPAHRQHPLLRAGCRVEPLPAGRARRQPHRRRGPGRGLRGPAGADRRTVPARSVLAGARRPDVRDGRPGALLGGRHDGVPGPDRPPGQGARLPDRAGGDRGGALPPSRRAGGGRAGAGGRPRREGSGRVRRAGPAAGARRRRAAGLPAGDPSRIHGSLGLRRARGHAGDRQRQARPRGAARAAGGPRRPGGGFRGAPQRPRAGHRRRLVRGPPARPGRRAGELLRGRRQLAAAGPPAEPAAPGDRPRGAVRRAVPASDDREPGAQPGGWRAGARGAGRSRARPHRDPPGVDAAAPAEARAAAGPQRRTLRSLV